MSEVKEEVEPYLSFLEGKIDDLAKMGSSSPDILKKSRPIIVDE